VVALNRAIAIGEVRGPAVAPALVYELDLDNYHPYHATRADLLGRLGRNIKATAAYERAAAMTRHYCSQPDRTQRNASPS
jgi:RNA polymerase sigma-70 factor (ECF subfamily)